LVKTLHSFELSVDLKNTLSNGSEAYEFILKNLIDVVITDIDLPGMSGLDVAHEVNRRKYGCKFIIIGDREKFSYEYACKAIEADVVSYLLKPIIPETLRLYVLKAINELKMHIGDLSMKSVGRVFPLVIEQTDSRQSVDLADKIFKFILEHYKEPLSITDIINKFYISESYISRLLMKYRGKSFKKILTGIRIEKAKELMLQYPVLSIEEISYMVGYNEYHYFSRMYKAYTGVAPSFDRKHEKP